jgi:hypothetical protein
MAEANAEFLGSQEDPDNSKTLAFLPFLGRF